MKNKKILNIFDYYVISLVFIILLSVFLSFKYKTVDIDNNVDITIKVSNSETIKALMPVLTTSKNVYINGSNRLVQQKSFYDDSVSNGGLAQNVYIVLSAPGKVGNDNNSFFNGQRILINQKVEIHGNYVAQGYITEIEDAN